MVSEKCHASLNEFGGPCGLVTFQVGIALRAVRLVTEVRRNFGERPYCLDISGRDGSPSRPTCAGGSTDVSKKSPTCYLCGLFDNSPCRRPRANRKAWSSLDPVMGLDLLSNHSRRSGYIRRVASTSSLHAFFSSGVSFRPGCPPLRHLYVAGALFHFRLESTPSRL